MDHNVVDCKCVEKKFPSYSLDKFDRNRAKEWSSINMRILYGLFVAWLIIFG